VTASTSLPFRGRRLTLLSFFIAFLFLLPLRAGAQDSYLLLITGVGGGDEFSAQYQKWAAAIVDGATKHGVAAANVTFLSETPEKDTARAKAKSTRENVAQAFTDIAAKAKLNDEVFIILIGHGSFDGKMAAFNLPGPDLTAEDYKGLLDKLIPQRVIFVNTAASSGGFIEHLKSQNRVIVAATKTGGERNDPRFPGYFVEALDAEAADRDRNGRVSILEAFDYAKAKVEAAFQQENHILTEHATIEDGSQGKLAGAVYLSRERTRDAATAAAAAADPALRALLEQQDSLEKQVAELRLKKESMDPAQYEQQLEKLLTDLAVKTREIRERQTRK
jgi:hypothetical protein